MIEKTHEFETLQTKIEPAAAPDGSQRDVPAPIERRLRRRLPLMIGHLAYAATHPSYRREVGERTRDIIWRLERGTSHRYRKHILPPRSIEGTIHDMRDASQMLAYDIARRLRRNYGIAVEATERYQPMPGEPHSAMDYSVFIEVAS